MDSSKAAAIWDKNNTKQYKVKLQLNTDRDIINLMDQISNKPGYIKQLIRADMDSGKTYTLFMDQHGQQWQQNGKAQRDHGQQ